MRFKSFVALSALTFATLLLFTAIAGAVGSISGQVKLEHEVALIPVEGATVGAISADAYLRGMASPADSHFVATARTDSSGNYRLENLPAGDYRIVVCKMDLGCLFYDGAYGSPHSKFAKAVMVADGEETSGINVTFRPFVPEPPPFGVIAGRITDAETGAPLPSARVIAFIVRDNYYPTPYVTVSDTDGGYRLRVPPESYHVFADRPDYERGEYPGNPVQVDSGDTVRGIDIALTPSLPPNPAFISGRITDAETGEGIVGAWVGASGEFLTIIFQTKTGPDGRYFLPVSAGGYFVRAAAQGYMTGEYPGNPVRVEAYDTVSGIDIALRPDSPPLTGFIAGKVFDAETRAGVPDAWVGASGEFLRIIFETRTGPDGRYLLPVWPGRYNVRAAAPGYEVGEYPGNPVAVEAYDTVFDVNIALFHQPISIDFGSISGRVTNAADDTPIPHALVIARQGDGCGFGQAFTDENGNYRIFHLRAGLYKVAALARGFFPAVYPNPVAVRPGENTPGIDLRLRPVPPPDVGTISGMVTDDSTGAPLAGAVVAAVGFEPTFHRRIVRFTHTDSDGRYLLGRLPKIPYFVIAWARGYFAEIYDNVRRFEDATKVTPDASGIDFALTRRFNFSHSLAGLVQSRGEMPLPGALVQAVDGGGSLVGAALSLPDGGFVVEGLSSGNYTVSAALEGASAEQNVAVSGALAGVNLTLPTDAVWRGDINGDGNYAPSDVALLLKGVFVHAGSLPDWSAADVNCDGKLSPSDVAVEIRLVFLSQPAGVCGF